MKNILRLLPVSMSSGNYGFFLVKQGSEWIIYTDYKGRNSYKLGNKKINEDLILERGNNLKDIIISMNKQVYKMYSNVGILGCEIFKEGTYNEYNIPRFMKKLPSEKVIDNKLVNIEITRSFAPIDIHAQLGKYHIVTEINYIDIKTGESLENIVIPF